MDDRAYGPAPTVPVRRAAMVQSWEHLTFLHWRYPATSVQRLLPPGLEVETHDGTAWVGLVPFFMRVAVPHTPPVPWLGRFPETNVRTYVRGPDGTSGIWFFSLDAARLPPVLFARTAYRLPYKWSRMQVDQRAGPIRYMCRRRWPGPRGARSDVVVRIYEPYAGDELTELDHFLTARWVLYSVPPGGLCFVRAFHPPWTLQRARLLHIEDELVRAAGLPEPDGEPLVHFGGSVKVRIGWPHRARS